MPKTFSCFKHVYHIHTFPYLAALCDKNPFITSLQTLIDTRKMLVLKCLLLRLCKIVIQIEIELGQECLQAIKFLSNIWLWEDYLSLRRNNEEKLCRQVFPGRIHNKNFKMERKKSCKFFFVLRDALEGKNLPKSILKEFEFRNQGNSEV